MEDLFVNHIMKVDNVPCEIEEGLYLGSFGAASNRSALKSLNVTHVLTVSDSLSPPYPDDFIYNNIKVRDTSGVNLSQYFDDCFTFIEDARMNEGGVLVHCLAGISRSATVVVAYLMYKYGMRLSEALEHVKNRRPVISPNPGFMRQLKLFEKSLQGKWIKMGLQEVRAAKLAAQRASKKAERSSTIRGGERLEPGTNLADLTTAEAIQNTVPVPRVEEVATSRGDAPPEPVAAGAVIVEVTSEGSPPREELARKRKGKMAEVGGPSSKKPKHPRGFPTLPEGAPLGSAAVSASDPRPRRGRPGVLRSEGEEIPWNTFVGFRNSEDQEVISRMPRSEVAMKFARSYSEAIQYELNLLARDQELENDRRAKEEALELMKAETLEQGRLLLASREREAKLEEEVEIHAQRLRDLKSGKEAAEGQLKCALEMMGADWTKAAEAIQAIRKEVEGSRPVLRLEAARAFMFSPVYRDLIASRSVEDMELGKKLTLGQLKHLKRLPADFDPELEEDLDMALDENCQEPPAVAEGTSSTVELPLESNEFFDLLSVDPEKDKYEDSFEKAYTNIFATIDSTAGIGTEEYDFRPFTWKDPEDQAECSKIGGEKEKVVEKVNSPAPTSEARSLSKDF